MLRLMGESTMERAENRVKGLKRRVGLERHAGFGRAIEQHPLPSGFVVTSPDEHLHPERPIIGVGNDGDTKRRELAGGNDEQLAALDITLWLCRASPRSDKVRKSDSDLTANGTRSYGDRIFAG